MEVDSADVPEPIVSTTKMESPAGAVPGENLQDAVEHGEYLLVFPTLSICLGFTEIVSYIFKSCAYFLT
jgi:hypothetical protein